MKTITFYSYKGGVGRSLALSNIAMRLSEHKKKVCVLDFDLEAPGLHFKFKDYKNSSRIERGIVDYIYEFSHHQRIPDRISNYSTELTLNNTRFKPITFIPAGNIEESSYWRKLSSIKWSDLFYSENAQGVNFFLDLKAKIESEFSPDFLLIDSRTGITDISGITLRLLADEAVILAANNEENFYGSRKVLLSLLNTTNALFGRTPKIAFALTRLPFTDAPEDREKEYLVVERVKKFFKNDLSTLDFDISVIHSDRRLEENERHLIGYEYEEKRASISNDYLKLFERITSDVLTPVEIQTFKNRHIAEREFHKSLLEKTDTAKKIEHLNKAIELNSDQYEYFLNRGLLFHNNGELDKAEEDYNKALSLNPNHWLLYFELGQLYFNRKNTIKAIQHYDKALELNPNGLNAYYYKCFALLSEDKLSETAEIALFVLEKINTNDHIMLNTLADIRRQERKYEEAYSLIYRAIALNPNQAIYFGTLAEIHACQNKIEEFYLNLTIALSKGIQAKSLKSAKEVYVKFIRDERFLTLMNKYNIDIDEIIA